MGYGRLGEPAQTELLNALYEREWSQFRNFFCPAMNHIRTEVEESRKRRVYDKPTTRFERLKASGQADAKKIECLERVKASLNPFELKRAIERQLRRVLQLRGARMHAGAQLPKWRSFKPGSPLRAVLKRNPGPFRMSYRGMFESPVIFLPGVFFWLRQHGHGRPGRKLRRL